MIELSGVRAIFFDAVGTLIHPDPPAAVVYAQIGRRFGSRLTATTVAVRLAEALAREERIDREKDLRTSEAREQRRWQDIVGRVLDDVADAGECFWHLYRHFSMPEAWRLAPQAGEILQQLERKKLVLGLASNYDRRLRSVVAGLPGLRGLNQLVISSEVGWRKPAPAFFAAVVRLAAVAPNQILYVGDDWANDYQGARSAGLRAVLLDPGEPLPADVARISRLGDLLPGAAE